jgi:hypothetical protein
MLCCGAGMVARHETAETLAAKLVEAVPAEIEG